MKNFGITLVILVIIIGGLIAADYYWWNKIFFKPKEDNEDKTKSSNANSSSNVAAAAATNNQSTIFPLKKGSIGIEVKYLQAAINTFQGQNLKVDGVFGSATQNALYKIFKVKAVPEKDYNIWVKPYIPEIKRRYELQGIIL